MTNPSLAAPHAADPHRSGAPASRGLPSDALALPKGGPDLLLIGALLAVLAVLVRAVWFTPVEAMQGPAQKIFYVHVPAAVVGLYLGLPLVALCSAVYLWLRDERVDRVAEAAAEVSLVFLSAVLLTGPLWGKPVWGTWWTWDARLTLTLFLWFVVLGYLVMRGALEDRQQRARFSAVLGLLAVLLVPFIHLSVVLFRTMHPRAIVLKPSAPSLPPEMLRTLLVSMAVFTLLYVGLVTLRYGLGLAEDAREEGVDAG